LFGLGSEAIPILQSYLDRTADVQTIALLCASGPPALLQHPRAQRWIRLYANLLNTWQLYDARCVLNICVATRLRLSVSVPRHGASASSSPKSYLHGGDSSKSGGGASAHEFIEPLAQVFARCSFCSYTLVTNSTRSLVAEDVRNSRTVAGVEVSGRGGGGNGALPNRQMRSEFKHSRCPNLRCKKPLPRCAICQQHLGCPDPDLASSLSERPDGVLEPVHVDSEPWSDTSSAFGRWIVWCQSCRHGGHAAHLIKWFEQHSECAISGCTCHCAQLDQAMDF